MSRTQRLQDALSVKLAPLVLRVEDESHQHSRPGVETHVYVLAVSTQFEGLTLLARHRLVNELAKAEFATGLHALSLHLYTPTEWDKSPHALKSPNCRSQA